jgi:hypothetical protein
MKSSRRSFNGPQDCIRDNQVGPGLINTNPLRRRG